MRIGILGGTFDPVHEAHLFVAREGARLLCLDEVWLMVARVPPHKQGQRLASVYHRFAMAALAVRDEEKLLVSDWELQRQGTSYTVDTMGALAAEYPSRRLCFLAGSDSLRELHSWKDCDTLLRGHCLAFVPRPGADLRRDSLAGFPALSECLRGLGAADPPPIAPGCCYLLPTTAPAVSSSDIRALLASRRRPPAEQLPPSVFHYIQKHRLYEKDQT